MIKVSDTTTSEKFDSRVVQIPREAALANGFPEKRFVSLTMRNGKLDSEIVEYIGQSEKEVE